ncbi:MAG TPA: primosomal protein N' [Spirochaetaceae bacterium]|nr:primosomal protein N' [Spirochaetaceae bacterium]
MIVQVVILDLPYNVRCDYTYSVPPDLCGRDLVGCRVEVPFSRQRKYGVVISSADDADAPEGIRLASVLRVIDDKPLLSEELLSLGKWISEFYVSSMSESLSLILPSTHDRYRKKPKTRSEKDRGLSSQGPCGGNKTKTNAEITFNDEQQKAFDKIAECVAAEDFRMLYLRGVTGSGKTEVLMRAARKAVDEGHSVLYLVPEIALTNQLRKTASELFSDDEMAVVHSNVTQKMRTDIFERCKAGEVKMVLGTRSSAFSPLRDLKMIIVDEEQDQSYKGEHSPRFHVRQVVQKRAQTNRSTLVFASATPSLECMKAINDGKVEQLVLSRRISDSGMPDIVTVLRKNADDVISDELLELMRNELDNNRGVILFLNRRGYLYHYKCQTCGFEMICPDCSVSMTYHRSRNTFVCHRCKREIPYFVRCPQCGNSNELYSGYGTEYVERVLKNLFPFSSIVRMDADSTSRKGESERIIRDFESGKINILVGTQMVSKGFNFRNLRLVGIINASQNNMSADFRQDERLFSLLVQVAGRSGRFSKDSKVLIQTDGSACEIIKYIESGQFDMLYETEMSIRKAFMLPPFSRMGRIVIRSEDEVALKKFFGEISFLLHKLVADASKAARYKIAIVQEGPCPVCKEAGRYRMQFLLKSGSANAIVEVFNLLKGRIEYKSNVKVDFDVDPFDFT